MGLWLQAMIRIGDAPLHIRHPQTFLSRGATQIPSLCRKPFSLALQRYPKGTDLSSGSQHREKWDLDLHPVPFTQQVPEL